MSMIHNTQIFGRSAPVRGKRLGVLKWVGAAFTAQRSRIDLRNLDEHMLDDIGVTRDQANIEADRPIWNVPAHWLR